MYPLSQFSLFFFILFRGPSWDLNSFTFYCLLSSLSHLGGNLGRVILQDQSLQVQNPQAFVLLRLRLPEGDWDTQTTPTAATHKIQTLLEPSDKMQTTPRGQRALERLPGTRCSPSARGSLEGEGRALLVPGPCAAAWGSCSGRR